MGQTQPGLPFNTLFSGVNEEGTTNKPAPGAKHTPPPRRSPTAPQIASPCFEASGGLLTAEWREHPRPMPALHYPKPSEVVVDVYLPDRDDDDTPDEEEVAAWVEHTAQTLYDLIHESNDLERVARRFEKPGSKPTRVDLGIALRAEQATVHADYHEALDAYRCLMGDEAANELADWVEQLCTRRGPATVNLAFEEPSP